MIKGFGGSVYRDLLAAEVKEKLANLTKLFVTISVHKDEYKTQ